MVDEKRKKKRIENEVDKLLVGRKSQKKILRKRVYKHKAGKKLG